MYSWRYECQNTCLCQKFILCKITHLSKCKRKLVQTCSISLHLRLRARYFLLSRALLSSSSCAVLSSSSSPPGPSSTWKNKHTCILSFPLFCSRVSGQNRHCVNIRNIYVSDCDCIIMFNYVLKSYNINTTFNTQYYPLLDK